MSRATGKFLCRALRWRAAPFGAAHQFGERGRGGGGLFGLLDAGEFREDQVAFRAVGTGRQAGLSVRPHLARL